MAGLGLTNALGAYQQGLAWNQQQQERERQQQQIAKQEARQAQLEAANKAAASFIEQARAKAPNPEQWQPDDDTMFQAGAVRSRELARAGLFEDLAQNEVALEKQRMRARGSALQNWRLKRDPKQLIAQAYSTIPDGGTVQDVQPLDGGKRVKVKFSTGTEQEIDPEQLAGALEATLVDSAKYAALSIENNMKRTLEELRAERERGNITLRGEIDAKNEEAKFARQRQRDEAQNAADLQRTKISAGAQVQAAKIEAAGDGGRGKGGASLLKTDDDANGNVLLYFRGERSPTIAMGPDGRPIKSGAWAKRVDEMAVQLGQSVEGASKTLAVRRKMAADLLAQEAEQSRVGPLPAGLAAAQPSKPGASAPDFSSLWKK